MNNVDVFKMLGRLQGGDGALLRALPPFLSLMIALFGQRFCVRTLTYIYSTDC